MFVILCYDVVADNRRTRLLKRLKGYLSHVQKSVFEGEITDARFNELAVMIMQVINPHEDSVRIYRQCSRCISSTEIFGVGVYIEPGEKDEII